MSATIRQLTRPPRHHWFGYYDKLQIDPGGRRVLGMEVDFEHRSPEADDVIRLGMIDLEDGDRWIELGESRAWCWQQGCMLQWRPGSDTEIVWNDREGDRFVCHILDVETGKRRTLPQPIYTLSPDGRTAMGTDFRRIQDLRPGYGYPGITDPNRDVSAPEDAGIYRLDLETGASQQVISIAEMAAVPFSGGDNTGATHYFNHLLFSPDGSRFIFLHRWRLADGSRRTRMATACPDGSEVRAVDESGRASHFIWRDPEHILAWTWRPSHESRFYLFRDVDYTGDGEVVGPEAMVVDGHCSYLPGGEWILNDCYPGEGERLQQLYLYHAATQRRVELGAFAAPPEYTGEWRCDLHPRRSPDGRWVTIDSPHGGHGRQIYLLELSEVEGLGQ